MEGPEEPKRQTAELRNEVLLELAANKLKSEDDNNIEHVQATGQFS